MTRLEDLKAKLKASTGPAKGSFWERRNALRAEIARLETQPAPPPEEKPKAEEFSGIHGAE